LACGEILYSGHENDCENKGILNIIGERPESSLHNFSINTGRVDHNVSKIIWGYCRYLGNSRMGHCLNNGYFRSAVYCYL